MTDSAPTMQALGEKAFLAGILPTLHADARFLNGFGHDASVLDLGLDGVDLVMKIDRAAKPIAALNGWADYRVWGRMAVTANCSDILTIGGAPKGFMLSVSVAGETPAALVVEVIAGAADECAKRDVAFLGGDTKEALGLNMVGAAIGTIAKGRHFNRRSGRKDDLLVLAGTVGGFLGGYHLCRSAAEPKGEALRYLCEPTAAWAEATAIAQLDAVRSACDLSDGLASAAMSIVAAGCGAILHFDKLPFHTLAVTSAAARRADLVNYAFGVGDWGILYAVDASARPQLEQLMADGLALSILGQVTDKPGLALQRDGTTFAVSTPENEHFRRTMEDQGDYFESLEAKLQLTLQR